MYNISKLLSRFQACPGSDWKQQYRKDQKLKARIVYVDPNSKQIKLSVQPELVDLTVRKLPSIGQVFEVSISVVEKPNHSRLEATDLSLRVGIAMCYL